MSEDLTPGDSETYSDLIDESIDDLNTASDFKDSGIDREQKEVPKKLVRWEHPALGILLLLAAASVGSYIYAKGGEDQSKLSRGRADGQIMAAVDRAEANPEVKKAMRNFLGDLTLAAGSPRTEADPSEVVDAMADLIAGLRAGGVDAETIEALEQTMKAASRVR